jgi:beta-lactamase class A
MRLRLAFALSLLAVASAKGAAGTSPGFERLQGRITNIAESSGLQVGVAVKDLTSGEQILVRGDEVFPQGSSIRIHLVTELFRQASAKKISLAEMARLPDSAWTGGSGVLRYMTKGTVSLSWRDYAALVITVNDNIAANLLLDRLGMDNINASLAAQGTPEIQYRRRAVSRSVAPNAAENIGTPRAVARSLELIHQGKVVDRATSDAILKLLALPEIQLFPARAAIQRQLCRPIRLRPHQPLRGRDRAAPRPPVCAVHFHQGAEADGRPPADL